MPRLSYFFGIAIYMYYGDHAPPHFHAIYGSQEAEVAIQSRRILKGKLSGRALLIVREWARIHEAERMNAWDRARDHRPLLPIAPLD